MISTNMLSANKVKLHGMTSTKWTTKDKITQYKGLINLYTRDKKIIEVDTLISQKKQTKELKGIQREIEQNRKDLENAVQGDKQKLRNTLAAHREMQLAFQNSQPQKVIDMVHQVNFTKRKTRDILKYRMKLKSDRLVDLKLRYALYEDRLKYDGQSWLTMLPCERTAHLITGKVNAAILRKEAAIYIRNAYKEMIAIMKKDALYFDAILVSIRNDGLNQGKCMINATKLGQLGAEYLDDRRQDFRFLEKVVKQDMVVRKRDLAEVRHNVEQFAENLKFLLRRDSDINLGSVNLPDSPSFAKFQEDLYHVEATLKYLKDAIFTPTIESIYPCLKEQLYQKERLTELVKKCENNRDMLLKKKNHAAALKSDLENTMIETTTEYTQKKKEYLEKIKEQEKATAGYETLIKSRYNLLANVRISLKHFQILSKLLASSQKNLSFKVPEFMPHTMEVPEEDEVDGVKMIPELQAKFSRLAANAKEILTGTALENGYKVFEHMIKARTQLVEADIVMSEESLIEAVFLDSSVLTRDDVKKKSAEIVAMNAVDEEQQLAVMPKRRKKFKF
ncbi:unnamed protein product [Acanthoscelides obtectus]|uniref:Uncharacterized protein n=2 Tax=Acanthoscelides obtectus TaxID=200917 RepID=A0A9P0NVN4_ACAOB|nr:unnamed protein product [Acanthoscelides obtectus]CAK1634768.1 hypothetical protein AOBTE_LOCUS8895 [Acanthoscelides obtectus]